MRRWSSLQRQIYSVLDPALDIQVHCQAYRMQSQRGSTSLPRYWITLGKEVIWDYPRQFVEAPAHPSRAPIEQYPYGSDISAISGLLREYIDTPVAQLFTKRFERDQWGLINILRAADRRLGSRRWRGLRRSTRNAAAIRVLEARATRGKASEPSQRQGGARHRTRRGGLTTGIWTPPSSGSGISSYLDSPVKRKWNQLIDRSLDA